MGSVHNGNVNTMKRLEQKKHEKKAGDFLVNTKENPKTRCLTWIMGMQFWEGVR